MCDQIIHSLKSKDEANRIQDTEEESNPGRKSSFPSHFIDALFSVDEEYEGSENKATGKRISKIDEDHKVMLREVSSLPQERRRSLLLGVIDRLIRLDENRSSNEQNENLSNQSEKTDSTAITSSGSLGVVLNFTNESNKNVNNLTSKKEKNETGDGQHLSKTQQGAEKKDGVTNNQDKNKMLEEEVEVGSSSGVDNKAFDCSETESKPSPPDQKEEVVSRSPEIDRSTASGTLMKSKPSVLSPDLESALQATPGHKTVRAWFKNPQLYKVIYCKIMYGPNVLTL